MLTFRNLSVFILLIFSGQSVHAESISREQALALMEECKLFREQQIKPLRDIEIDKCANEQGKETAYCDRFYKDHGEAYRASNGVMQLGLFWDAPICEKALDIEKYFMLYPSKKDYQSQ